MSRRLREWEERIVPVLEAEVRPRCRERACGPTARAPPAPDLELRVPPFQEKRASFDIHTYGSHILEKMPTDQKSASPGCAAPMGGRPRCRSHTHAAALFSPKTKTNLLINTG